MIANAVGSGVIRSWAGNRDRALLEMIAQCFPRQSTNYVMTATTFRSVPPLVAKPAAGAVTRSLLEEGGLGGRRTAGANY